MYLWHIHIVLHSYIIASYFLQNRKRDFLSPSRSRQPSKQVPQQGHPSFESLPNSEPITNVPRSAESVDLRRQGKSCLPRPSRANSASRSIVR